MSKRSMFTYVLQIIVSSLLLVAFSIIVPKLLFFFNIWPQGNDVWGHIFKAEYLTDEIKNGNIFPIYSQYWYNGLELFRYWPPLAYYIISIISIFLEIDTIGSSVFFFSFCVFFSISGFFFIGLREKKPFIGTLFGIAYLFMPHNIEIILFEGNFPRILIMAFTPWIFFFIDEILKHKKRYAYVFLMLTICLSTFAHIMIAAMLGISIFLYVMVYSIVNKKIKIGIRIIITVILSYLPTSIILIPGLTGGIVSQDSLSSVDTINKWSQNGFLSLNIFATSNIEIFYYGLVFFIICVLGIIAYRRETISGFFVATIIFFGTTETFLPIVKMMPFSQVFWMRRFVPMAYVIGLFAIIYWSKLKHYIFYVFAFLLIIDGCIRFIPYSQNTYTKQETIQEEKSDKYLVTKGIEITDNRFAFIDLSATSSYQSYQIYKSKTKFAFGWSYQGAIDMQDIMSINEAFENKFYGYSFSKLIVLGCDTVSIRKDIFDTANWEEIKSIAKKLNYEVVIENENALLLKLKNGIVGEYGTKTIYENIAIGKSAYYISYIYPTFVLGNSDYIDDYSINELSKYKKIYLSGFDYHNKDKAESMLKELANNNIKIFIDGDSFKLNKSTGQKEFLGVYAQIVEFNQTFPIITMKGKPEFQLNMSTKDYSTWRTSYLINLEKETGTSYYGDRTLAYLGTDSTENITFIGYNLIYYLTVAKEEQLEYWVDYTFNEFEDNLPKIKYYPIKTIYNNNTITITTNENEINTNIACIDSFLNSKGTSKEGAFLVVNKGTHTLQIEWPYFKIGFIASLFGILISIFYCVYAILRSKEDE